MNLYIDTTDRTRTVVQISQDSRIIERIEETSTSHRNQTILLLIKQILEKQHITFIDLTAISVNTGPGSFTGIRVGVAIANTLGFALQIPINGEMGLVEPVYS